MSPKIAKSGEIPTKFELNSSSRSSKVTDLGVNRKLICDFLHTYTYIFEIYNALHSRGWLESEARAVARWWGLGRNGREVECF